MRDDSMHMLVPSTNKDRYALDDSEHGREITSGSSIAILLHGKWREGKVKQAESLHTGDYNMKERVPGGYYFIARDDNVYTLCSGMKICLL
jgi:Domain of unknown function (DUF5348)